MNQTNQMRLSDHAPAAHDPGDALSIAVIGMAGRFPGAATVDAFWDNLRVGVEGIRQAADAELAGLGVAPAALARPDYVKAVSMPADIECFDAAFFGMTPREAAITDPQHRLLLEAAWHALEHAGYVPDAVPGTVGLFAGAGVNTYLIDRVLADPSIREAGGSMQLLIANQADFLATKIAYQLNLRGPALTVQSACSTSLVAVHMACQSLLAGECDIAMAGGVAINTLGERGYFHTEGGIVSRDGHCRAFDARSDGTVPGNGLGLVVLKPLARALEDGDAIHAVIRGSAINNDGRDKMTYTAPSVSGQAAVIAEALSIAGVTPDTISYVETHGTGTALGDAVEIRALHQAFNSIADGALPAGFECVIGSVKTSIGHLDTAAGVTGLIKTVLALEHQQIPPSLHFTEPNPHLGLDNTPFRVAASLTPWPAGATPRRAGVSSFGIGGTNAHVILEEAPEAAATALASASTADAAPQLFVLSARTPVALARTAADLHRYVDTHRDVSLAALAHVLQTGRKAFPLRHAFTATTVDEMLGALARITDAPPPAKAAETPQVVFMFPGQGSQYVGMAADLYHRAPVFRDAIDRCADHLMEPLGLDLRELLFPASDPADSGSGSGSGNNNDSAAGLLNRTRITQPSLFAVEYALAQQLIACGIEPAAMVGHSVGEYVAACIAGVFSLPDALTLIVQRGALVDACPGGRMLAIFASPASVEPLLDGTLALAAVNSPGNVTVAGQHDDIERLAERLQQDGVAWQTLDTSHAFHSSMIEPALNAFGGVLRGIAMRPPAVPFVSNLTGTWITPAEAVSPDYWCAHLRGTVRFGDCLGTLGELAQPVLLEVGPGQALCSIARQQRRDAATPPLTAIPTTAHAKRAARSFDVTMQAFARLWQSGVTLPWATLRAQLGDGVTPRRIALPGYPFARERHWLGDAKTVAEPAAALPGARAAHDHAHENAIDPTHKHANTKANAALSGVPIDRALVSAAYEAPLTPLERRLVELGEALMGFTSLGIHDDFFELGGHSLLAAQFIAGVRQHFKVNLPIRAVFDGPSVAAIALHIEALVAQRTAADARESAHKADFAAATLKQLDEMSPEQLMAMLAEKKRQKTARNAALSADTGAEHSTETSTDD
jgi:acyl transferase domain-containing protein